jgi:hypothetical protein
MIGMIYELIIKDCIEVHDWLKGMLGMRLTNSKAAVIFSSGESFTHSTGRWSQRKQIFDRRHDQHEEAVTEQETENLFSLDDARCLKKTSTLSLGL